MPGINNIEELDQALENIKNSYNNELILRLTELQDSFKNSVATPDLFNKQYNHVVRQAHTNAQAELDKLDLTNVMALIAPSNSPRARNLPEPNLDLNASASATKKSRFKNLELFKNVDVAPNDKPAPQTEPTNFDLNPDEIKDFLENNLQNSLKAVPRLKISLMPQPGKKNKLEEEYRLRATPTTPRLTR